MLRYATPWFMVAAMTTVMLVRIIGIRLDKAGRGLPLQIRYYTWLYVVFFLLLLFALRSTFADVMRISSWLDSATIERTVRQNMEREEKEDAEEEMFRRWKEEASLEDYPILRWFSMLCPLWLVATFGTCLYHTLAHVAEIGECLKPGCQFDSTRAVNMHDKTIRILALPMIYGLMSFEGVVRMWGIVIDRTSTNHHFVNWEHRTQYQTDMFEACFMVADLYESYALLIFGVLTINVLRQKITSKIELVKVDVSPPTSPMAVAGSRGATHSFDELDLAIQDLMKELKGLTMLGVKLFCLTCFLQAIYKLSIMTLGFYDIYGPWFNTDPSQRLGLFQTKAVKKGAHYFFYGAGFVASFAAIGNVVEVERGFHRNLEEFSPFLKFWGVKVLVSIAFLQTLALLVIPPFTSWSETRSNIFYASVLCLECFLISVFHLRAWGPQETWYWKNSPAYSGMSDGIPEGSESNGDSSPD